MSIEAIAWKQMIVLMCTRQVSRREIMAHTGLSSTTVCRWLAVLHTAPGNLVYVSEYKRSATVGPYTEYYSFGFCQQDVPRPKPLTKREKNIRTRRRHLITTDQAQGVIRHVSR